MSALLDPLQGLSALQWVALVHALATCFLAGLIWTIQIVHYPLFAWVPPRAFTGQDTTDLPQTGTKNHGYEREHIRRITAIVGPAMLLEMVTAAALAYLAPPELRVPAIAALLALFAIWISTATTQGPLHMKIAENADRALIRKLVNTNWLRTVLWSARAVVAIAILPAVFA